MAGLRTVRGIIVSRGMGFTCTEIQGLTPFRNECWALLIRLAWSPPASGRLRAEVLTLRECKAASICPCGGGGTMQSPNTPRGSVSINQSGDLTMRSQRNWDVWINQGGGGYFTLRNLPTSNPGGSWRVWRDSNGFLRIT